MVVASAYFAPPLFFIAARKRVVSMAVLTVYALIIYGSAVLRSVLGNPKTGWVASLPSR